MNIIIINNQIKTVKEFPIKSCKEVRFSNGGNYFAAVNGTNAQSINVYHTYTGENPPSFVTKAHNGKIKHILWSRDDTLLISCG